MRKLISLVVALVFGVGAGLGSSELWVRARVLPYCKVANNADAYHLKFVRVNAKVHFADGHMFIYEDCDPVEALAASLQFEDGDLPDLGIPKQNELLRSNPTQIMSADAIVAGEFDAKFSQGCWGPKFRILTRKVELTSPIEDFKPPVSEGEGPALRLKH